MNKKYIDLIESMPSSQVSERLSKIVDLVDFDSIKTIFDVGSWHLNESIDFAKILPHAQVHAFEPNYRSVQECIANRERQPAEIKDRLFIHDIALCDKDGVIPFYPLDTNKSYSAGNPNHGISSLLMLEDGKNGQWAGDRWIQAMTMVRCSTIDVWCNTNNIYPDIIWSDVQGTELLLFRGGANTLKKHVRAIITEVGLKPFYKGHTLKPDIDELLKTDLEFVEVDAAFGVAGLPPYDFEANTIYINPSLLS